MSERRAEVSRGEKTAPASCWATARGPSSTPSDEEGFTYGADGRQREWRPDPSKNVSEQFQPVHRRQLANTGQHVFELERLGEKAVGACGETLVAHVGRAV